MRQTQDPRPRVTNEHAVGSDDTIIEQLRLMGFREIRSTLVAVLSRNRLRDKRRDAHYSGYRNADAHPQK